MLKIRWVCWGVICSLACAFNADLEANDRKIYGGRFASKGEFPYAVYIIHYINLATHGACGGTLATLSRIISAAHCLADKDLLPGNPDMFSVLGGTVKSSWNGENGEGAQYRRVTNITLPLRFGRRIDGSFNHDIGVAEVNIPFNASSTLSPMKVASLNGGENKEAWDKFVESGKACIAVGWGAQDASAPNHSQRLELLKAVEVKPWTDYDCEATVGTGDEFLPGDACGTQIKRGESTCDGDSGSPLICGGNVFGLTSAGHTCGTNETQYFTLFWPYLKYFGLGSDTSTVSNHFTSSLFILTTVLTALELNP